MESNSQRPGGGLRWSSSSDRARRHCVVMGLAPRLDLQAEGPTLNALAAAIEVCKAALSPPTAAEVADEAEAVGNNSSPEQPEQAPGGRKKPGASLSALRKLSTSTIFNESVPKVQGVLSAFLADRERDHITEELKRLAAVGGT
jgi:hypothetical protein